MGQGVILERIAALEHVARYATNPLIDHGKVLTKHSRKDTNLTTSPDRTPEQVDDTRLCRNSRRNSV